MFSHDGIIDAINRSASLDAETIEMMKRDARVAVQSWRPSCDGGVHGRPGLDHVF